MHLPHSRSRPTIEDVAEHAGVSIATVSRVLNKTASVQEKTASRVLSAVEALKYRPKAAARILARQKTDTIGLLLPVISGDFFAEMLQGIERGVVEGGYNLLIHSTFSGAKPNSPYKHVLGEHNTDGLLVFSDSLDEEELRRFYDIGFPVVLLHRSSPAGVNIPCVTVENKNGARAMVEHLIVVHGKRRIVFLRGPLEEEDSRWRELGYQQALNTHGIPCDPELVVPGEFDRNIAQASIRDLITRKVDFDAVFSGDDEAAVGVLFALHEAGILIPDNVSVVGFDDQRMSPYLTPPLTTVCAPTEEVGREAARQLIRLIHGQEATPLTLLPTEIVIRRSCGCA